MVHNTRLLLSLLLAMTLPWPAGADSQDRQYVLDLSGAEVGFSVNVLGLFRVSGRFDQVEGGLLFSESCTAKSIAFSIQTASVNTNNRLRDGIIRGPALLNSRDYPVIAFTSSHIVSNKDGPGMITGKLNMNGKSRQVSFRIEPGQRAPGDSSPTAGYQAVASISRADFGIPSPMIGTSDTVQIRVSLQLRQETLRLASSTTTETTP
jgi:polyisoprenoid-binding protein YceI